MIMFEEIQDGCLVTSQIDDLQVHRLEAISESSYCWKPSIWFLIKRIYGLEEDVG